MLRKILFVGVGGSGGKTLRALKQTLERHLEQNGWDRGIPGGWQFLQVDTAYDGVAFPAPMLGLNEFCGMVADGMQYNSTVTTLQDRLLAPGATQKALTGWCDPSSTVPINAGAGQVRTIGRLVSANGLPYLHSRVKETLSRLNAPGNDQELDQLTLKLHPKASQKRKDPMVILVSSIAGGSGAGMMLDVSEAIKAAGSEPWLREQHALLYVPEVFESIAPNLRAQIPMNALGAMAELVAATWATAPSEGTRILFEAQAVRPPFTGQAPAVGPVATYLVGSRNSAGVDLTAQADPLGGDAAGMDEVFLAVGEALAGLVTNQAIADDMDAYFYTNVFVQSGRHAVVADSSGLKCSSDNDERMPFGAMGFARLSLGMDRLLDYASEGIVREHVAKMLFPALEPQDPANPVEESVLLEKQVNAGLADFIRDSWLSEKNPNDQIVNVLRGDLREAYAWDYKLRDQQTGSARKARAAALAMKCRPQVPAGKQLSAAQWKQAMQSSFDAGLRDYLREERQQVEENGKKFTRSLQAHLANHVADAVAMHGLRATAAMLRRLAVELNSVATSEMPDEATTMRQRVSGYDIRIDNVLGGAPNLSENSPQVQDALQTLEMAAQRFAEAELLEIVPGLLLDIARNLLEPMAEGLELTHQKLFNDYNGTGQSSGGVILRRFANLAEDRQRGDVSGRYKPRQVERLLIKPQTFPQELEMLSRSDLPREKADGWASHLMRSSLHGQPLRALDPSHADEAKQSLITLITPWTPQDVHFREDASMGAASGEIRLPGSVAELVKRARAWFMDQQSAFGRHYRMPIADYCRVGNQNVLEEKATACVLAFGDLLDLSAPLININKQAVTLFHSHTDAQLTPNGRLLKLSTIPFDMNKPVGQAIGQTLLRHGLRVEDFEFDEASSAKDVFAFSTTKSAMQPMVFSSLIEPIAQSWLANRGTKDGVDSFWQGRRARPLLDAIPASPKIVHSYVAGWFIADAFSLIVKQESTDASLGPVVTLWHPNNDPDKRLLAFPWPLLPASSGDSKLLPSVLMSLSLAIVQAGNQVSRDPLKTYEHLRDLGREVTHPDPARIATLNRAPLDVANDHRSSLMSDWILTGVLPTDAPRPQLLVGPEDKPRDVKTAAERRNLLVDSFVSQQADYLSWWPKLADKPWQQVPQVYELRDVIDLVLATIVQSVQSMSVTAGGGDTSIPKGT